MTAEKERITNIHAYWSDRTKIRDYMESNNLAQIADAVNDIVKRAKI